MRPTLFLPISTLFLFPSSTTIPFIITYSIHPSQNKHSTFIPKHSLPNTLLRKNQGNSLRSLNIYSLCMRIHPSRRNTRDAAITTLRTTTMLEGLQKDETTAQKPSFECACVLLCNAVQCCAMHCIKTLNSQERAIGGNSD